MEIKPETASTAVLVEAYPIGIGWDNADDTFVAELSSFDVEVHAENWQEAMIFAREAQRLLIETYRAHGYTLPSL